MFSFLDLVMPSASILHVLRIILPCRSAYTCVHFYIWTEGSEKGSHYAVLARLQLTMYMRLASNLQ